MKFSLVILGAPYTDQAAETAYRFAVATLARGHTIQRLFFYHDGVHNASDLLTLPQDELQPAQRWRDLIERHHLDAVVCIAAALRRGVLDDREARRFGKTAHNLGNGIRLAGLGELLDAARASDRLVTFGPTS